MCGKTHQIAKFNSNAMIIDRYHYFIKTLIMFVSSRSQLSSVLNWSQSSGEEVVDGLSVVVEFPISSYDVIFQCFADVEEYDDFGDDTKYDGEVGADDDDINDIADADCEAPLHDGRSACSPNAGPQLS